MLNEQSRRDFVDSVSNSFEKIDVIGHSVSSGGDGDEQVYLLAKEQFGMGTSEKIECILTAGDDAEKEDGKGVKIINLGRNPHSTVTIEDPSTGINQQYVMYEVHEQAFIKNQTKY